MKFFNTNITNFRNNFGLFENALSPIIELDPFDLTSRTGKVLILMPNDFLIIRSFIYKLFIFSIKFFLSLR